MAKHLLARFVDRIGFHVGRLVVQVNIALPDHTNLNQHGNEEIGKKKRERMKGGRGKLVVAIEGL